MTARWISVLGLAAPWSGAALVVLLLFLTATPSAAGSCRWSAEVWSAMICRPGSPGWQPYQLADHQHAPGCPGCPHRSGDESTAVSAQTRLGRIATVDAGYAARAGAPGKAAARAWPRARPAGRTGTGRRGLRRRQRAAAAAQERRHLPRHPQPAPGPVAAPRRICFKEEAGNPWTTIDRTAASPASPCWACSSAIGLVFARLYKRSTKETHLRGHRPGRAEGHHGRRRHRAAGLP